MMVTNLNEMSILHSFPLGRGLYLYRRGPKESFWIDPALSAQHAIKNIDKIINADCDDYDYYDRGTYSKRGRMSGIKRHEEDRSRNEVVRSNRYE